MARHGCANNHFLTSTMRQKPIRDFRDNRSEIIILTVMKIKGIPTVSDLTQTLRVDREPKRRT